MEIDRFPDWDPDSFAGMSAWAKLTAKEAAKGLSLASTASIMTTTPGLSNDQEERGWGRVSQDFYGKFLKGMQAGLDQTPFPLAAQLWVAGYDGRNPNSLSAQSVGSGGYDRRPADLLGETWNVDIASTTWAP